MECDLEIHHMCGHIANWTQFVALFHPTVLWKKNLPETVNLKVILKHPENLGGRDSLPWVYEV